MPFLHTGIPEGSHLFRCFFSRECGSSGAGIQGHVGGLWQISPTADIGGTSPISPMFRAFIRA